jgi:hypothetical protein
MGYAVLEKLILLILRILLILSIKNKPSGASRQEKARYEPPP